MLEGSMFRYLVRLPRYPDVVNASLLSRSYCGHWDALYLKTGSFASILEDRLRLLLYEVAGRWCTLHTGSDKGPKPGLGAAADDTDEQLVPNSRWDSVRFVAAWSVLLRLCFVCKNWGWEEFTQNFQWVCVRTRLGAKTVTSYETWDFQYSSETKIPQSRKKVQCLRGRKKRKANVKTKQIKTKLTCFLLREIIIHFEFTPQPSALEHSICRKRPNFVRTSGFCIRTTPSLAALRYVILPPPLPPGKFQCRKGSILALFGLRQLCYAPRTTNVLHEFHLVLAAIHITAKAFLHNYFQLRLLAWKHRDIFSQNHRCYVRTCTFHSASFLPLR
jgi:hypothetical protein